MHIPSHLSFDSYLRIWKAVLIPLLGWSDLQVERWAARYKEFFDGRVHAIHNLGPLRIASEELLPLRIERPAHARSASDIVASIETIVGDFVERTACVDELSRTDWQPVKTAIDKVLRTHGETFDDLVREKAQLYQN